MNSKPRERVKLFLIFLAVIIFNFVSCNSATNKYTGGKHKYLEVDDLRGFDSPGRRSGDEEVTNIHEDMTKAERPRKIEKRSPRVDVGLNGAQQVQPKRAPRQQLKKQRPGFFWTLARVTFETFNDTRSAIQQINEIIKESIPDELPPQKQSLASLKMKVTTTTAPGNETESETEPSTEEPEFKLSRPLLLSLVRRNVNGLVRLFNIEWRDAISQSQKNVKEFQRDLSKQVGMYLQDNPNNY